MDETFSEKQEFVFPFTAIVGQQEAKRALILALINPGLSLLIWGDEGLGKRTLLRSASHFLPKIESTGCDFNCDPKNRMMMCSSCLKGGWKKREIRAPFVIVPYYIKKENLLGTEENPSSSLIGRGNRGILAVRNLENHSKDVVETIFSAAKTRKMNLGDFSYPCQIQIMATYTGEPGKITENFTLKAHVREIEDIEERIEIVRRAGLFRKDPESFVKTYAQEEEKLKKKIERSRKTLKRVSVPKNIGAEVRKIIKEYGLKEEYGRLIIAAATANAAYEDRLTVGKEDLKDVIPLVIPFNP